MIGSRRTAITASVIGALLIAGAPTFAFGEGDATHEPKANYQKNQGFAFHNFWSAAGRAEEGSALVERRLFSRNQCPRANIPIMAGT